MKIFKLSQNIVNGYDTYDSCVVIAESEEEARRIHPSQFVTHIKDNKWMGTYSTKEGGEYETENELYSTWVQFEDIDKINVEYLGESTEKTKRVVVASFNAG